MTDDLIEAIRTAIGASATPEQKATGAQACRTILAALDVEPGKTLILPGAPQSSPLARLAPGQALDLLIGKLAAIADARDAKVADAPRPDIADPRVNASAPALTPAAMAPRISFVPTPRVMRPAVPLRAARAARRRP